MMRRLGRSNDHTSVTAMRFVPYAEAADLPNIVVDGAAAAATVLTLSHWPKSGTPETLRADTSAEIVFKYLDAPAMHVDVGAASNNHFDEDGLIGIFALTRPDLAASMACPAGGDCPGRRLRHLSFAKRRSNRLRARGVCRDSPLRRCRDRPSPGRTRR